MPVPLVKYLLNLAADMKPEDIPLQPWAAALYKERIDNNGKDHPGVRCLPSGIPEKDTIPDGLKIVQTPDLVVFLHDSRTIFRQIFTDGRPLPKNPQPTWMRQMTMPAHYLKRWRRCCSMTGCSQAHLAD